MNLPCAQYVVAELRHAALAYDIDTSYAVPSAAVLGGDALLEPAAHQPDWISETDHGRDLVDSWLNQLEVPRDALVNSIRAGIAERRHSNPFEPTMAAGMRDWICRVGNLRKLLNQQGWKPVNRQNAPFARRGDGKIMLGVMPGDTGTGHIARSLRSSYPRGPATEALTSGNEPVHEPIPGLDDFLERTRVNETTVWFLVTRLERGGTGGDRVHFELSEPAPTQSGDLITSWAKRCCFDALELPPLATPAPTENDPIDVPVSWR